MFAGLASKKIWNVDKSLCIKALSILPKDNPKFIERRSQLIKVLVTAGLFNKSNVAIILSLLQTACIQNDRDLLKNMLDQGVLNRFPGEVLPHICAHGTLEMVKMVLDHTANQPKSWTGQAAAVFSKKTNEINLRNSADCSPLAIASERGHTQMVKLLLDHGADVTKDTVKIDGRSVSKAFYSAGLKGHIRIVKLLLPKVDRQDVLTRALDSQPRLLKASLAFLGPINNELQAAANEALNRAIKDQDLESAQILLDYGAIPSDLLQSVTVATSKGNLKLVQSFLKTDPDHQSRLPIKALMPSIDQKDLLMMQTLCEHGLAQSTADDAVVFFGAYHTNDLIMFSYFLDHIPRVPDVWREMVVKDAVKQNNLPMAKLLLEKGGIPEAYKNNSGFILEACEHNNEAMAELFLNHGLRVSKKDGSKAFEMACENRNLAFIQSLINHDVPLDFNMAISLSLIRYYDSDSNIFNALSNFIIDKEPDSHFKTCLMAVKNNDFSEFQAALLQLPINLDVSKVSLLFTYTSIYADPSLMEAFCTCFSGHDVLKDGNAKKECSIAAAAIGNIDTLGWLLSRFPGIHDKVQVELAHLVNEPVSLNIATNLLKAGAFPDKNTLNLYLHEKVITLLEQHHLLNIRDKEGRTLLDFACEQNKHDLILQLIAAGMDPQIAYNYGYSAQYFSMIEAFSK